jgi:hypothetical protein
MSLASVKGVRSRNLVDRCIEKQGLLCVPATRGCGAWRKDREFMLTPAEELGLSGLSLATRVRKAFFRIPETRLIELTEEIRAEAFRRHIVYERDGVEEAIHIMPMPITVLPDQLSYIHYVSQTITNALKRLPDLYLQDAGVRAALLLPEGEEQWLRDCWTPAQRENNPIFGRLDAMVDLSNPTWGASAGCT